MPKKFVDAPVKSIKDRIIRFKTVGDVILTVDEERALLRWETADELMRVHTPYIEVRDALVEKFGVSKTTADKDYFAAQEIFARTRSINKKYEGSIHLDRIKKMIAFYEDKLMEKDPETGKPAAGLKEMEKLGAILSRLYDNYTYTLNSIPSEVADPKTIVPSMIFRMTQNNHFNSPMDPEKAMEMADQYIDYENVQPDDE